MQLRLPEEKLSRLAVELDQAVGRKVMLKKELQSLTGLLQHATKVVRPGRAFMRSLHVLQSVGKLPTHKVRLNMAARADIIWWQVFYTQLEWDFHAMGSGLDGTGSVGVLRWLGLWCV